MLPEALSNGLCSLKPDEDRLCLVCDMSINDDGTVTRARFDAAVMRSQARLTYQQVWDWIVSGRGEIRPGATAVSASLRDLYGLYKALRKARSRRGAIISSYSVWRKKACAKRFHPGALITATSSRTSCRIS